MRVRTWVQWVGAGLLVMGLAAGAFALGRSGGVGETAPAGPRP
jgi:hypothetical protein